MASIDQQPFWARAHNKVCKQKGDNHCGRKFFSGAKAFRLEATCTDCFVRPSLRLSDMVSKLAELKVAPRIACFGAKSDHIPFR